MLVERFLDRFDDRPEAGVGGTEMGIFSIFRGVIYLLLRSQHGWRDKVNFVRGFHRSSSVECSPATQWWRQPQPAALGS